MSDARELTNDDAKGALCEHGRPGRCPDCEELASLEAMTVDERRDLLARIVGWMAS